MSVNDRLGNVMLLGPSRFESLRKYLMVQNKQLWECSNSGLEVMGWGGGGGVLSSTQDQVISDRFDPVGHVK